jgi:hypothetical protein
MRPIDGAMSASNGVAMMKKVGQLVNVSNK